MNSFGYDEGITAMKRGGQMRFNKKFGWGGPNGTTWIPDIDQTPVDESYTYDANGQITGLGTDHYIRQYWNEHPDEYLKLHGSDEVAASKSGTNWGGIASGALGGITDIIGGFNELSEKRSAINRGINTYGQGIFDNVYDNASLLNAYGSMYAPSVVTSKDLRNKSIGQDALSAVKTGVDMFTSSGGNWYVAAAGVIGSALGSMGQRFLAKRDAEELEMERRTRVKKVDKQGVAAAQNVDAHNDFLRMARSMNSPFNYSAYGGELRTHGLDFNNGFTFINEGGTHEQNPLEGVPSGVDENGVPNLVEEGEVIWNNEYVFSNRIKIPKHLADKYRLDTSMTFADAIKEVTKESLTRPNDPISNETNKALVNEFMDEQEVIRGKEQAKAKAELQKAYDDDFANQLAALTEGQAPAPAMGMQLGMPQGGMEGIPVEGEPVLSAFGGHKFLKGSYKPGLSGAPVKDLEDVYDSGNGVFYDAKTGAYYNSLDEIRLLRGMEVEKFDQINPVTVTADKKIVVPQPKAEDKPVVQAKVDTKAAEVKPKGEKDIKDLNATKHDDVIPFQYRPTWQRYAPVYGAGAMALYGMANRPNYESADAIIAAARQAGVPVNIPVETVGDFMTFKPFDERYLVNMANQNRAAAARGIVNTANGNRAMDLLGNMALAHSSQQELGEIMRQAYLANQTERARVADFNRATRLHNMSAINQRNLSQAQLNSQRQATALSGLAQGYGMRQNIRDTWDNHTMESLNSFLESLGAIGKENEEYNMMTSMAEHGYFPYYWGSNGTMQFAPTQQQPVVAQQAPVQVVQQVPVQQWQPDPNWRVNYQWQINAKGGVKKNKKRRF